MNTITAKAVNSKGTASKSINVTLDTAADKLFTYDNNGSLTKTTFGAKQTTYTYDYENRLTRVIAPAKGWSASGGSPPEGQGEASGLAARQAISTYKYDYLGRRIIKEVMTDDGMRNTANCVYDGDNIIAEYDANGTLITKYIYGPGIDEPIRMETLAPTRQICYYYFDGLGSVTDLSNTSGKQIEHYYYDPFGKTKIYDAQGKKLVDSAYNNRYRFTAREWDSESGLYYYRARYYDPKLGRFLQADPVGYEAGSLNLYKYCFNNPLRFRDPMGLEGDDYDPSEDWQNLLAGALKDLLNQLGIPVDTLRAIMNGETPMPPIPMPLPVPVNTAKELSGANDAAKDVKKALEDRTNFNNALNGVFDGFDDLKGMTNGF